jgi:hypothetical protein
MTRDDTMGRVTEQPAAILQWTARGYRQLRNFRLAPPPEAGKPRGERVKLRG